MSTDSFRIEDLKLHARWLRRLAQALAADGSGDDLVQDTMLAAWQHAPERRASLRPWLRRVLTNLGRMRRRSDRQQALRQQAWVETSAKPALTPDGRATRDLAGQLPRSRSGWYPHDAGNECCPSRP